MSNKTITITLTMLLTCTYVSLVFFYGIVLTDGIIDRNSRQEKRELVDFDDYSLELNSLLLSHDLTPDGMIVTKFVETN